MTDALLTLQSAVTKTATFNGTGVSFPYGTPRRGMVARLLYVASAATGTSTFTPSIDQSNDSGTTWFNVAAGQPITASTAATGEAFIPFSANLGAGASTQFRLTMTVAGGTTPSIVYSSDVGNAMP